MNLARPLCVFDIESTGVNVVHDRIVELCVLRVQPDGSETVKTWRVNPSIPIPEAATVIHGISNEDIADAPAFQQILPELLPLLQGSDLAGYNSNKFDIPMLAEELLRAGSDFDLSQCRSVDVQNIFHKKEQRTLSAAYAFYCQADLKNAHTAEADVRATYEVLKAQLERYEDMPKEIPALSDFSTMHRAADFAGFITFDAEGPEQHSQQCGRHNHASRRDHG